MSLSWTSRSDDVTKLASKAQSALLRDADVGKARALADGGTSLIAGVRPPVRDAK